MVSNDKRKLDTIKQIVNPSDHQLKSGKRHGRRQHFENLKFSPFWHVARNSVYEFTDRLQAINAMAHLFKL